MTNVFHIFMDTQIVKPVNAIMRDQRTKHVTKKAGVVVLLLTWLEINALNASKVPTLSHNV